MNGEKGRNWACRLAALLVGTVVLLVFAAPQPACSGWFSKSAPEEESAASKMSKLKIKPGPKMVIAVYEFRSGVPEISPRAATDMFVTALVASGAFAVVEREHLESSGVEREKELQQSEEATGQAGGSKLTGADYICEGAISEYDSTQAEKEVGVSLGGVETSRSNEARSIALDVRIINTSTGKIIDAVPVRKEVKASGIGASGLGNMLKTLTHTNIDADIKYKDAQRVGIDKALRDCIDEAVYQLVKRYMAE